LFHREARVEQHLDRPVWRIATDFGELPHRRRNVRLVNVYLDIALKDLARLGLSLDGYTRHIPPRNNRRKHRFQQVIGQELKSDSVSTVAETVLKESCKGGVAVVLEVTPVPKPGSSADLAKTGGPILEVANVFT
jgi:hypothetical protein